MGNAEPGQYFGECFGSRNRAGPDQNRPAGSGFFLYPLGDPLPFSRDRRRHFAAAEAPPHGPVGRQTYNFEPVHRPQFRREFPRRPGHT